MMPPRRIHSTTSLMRSKPGKHVILSFGDYESDLDYLLVSNLLTRKIREAWEEQTNQFRRHGENRTTSAGDRGGGSPQAAQP